MVKTQGGKTITEERKIEKTYTFDREKMANYLARIASEIANGELKVEGIEISIPQKLDLEYKYKKQEQKQELKLELKWEG